MRRLIIIILATVVISASASAGATAYILDRQWTEYHEQEVERNKQDGFARGYWRGTYEMCLIVFQGDTFVCLKGVKSGYKEGNHLLPAPPGWDWFYIRYQGQVQ
jgi:hypothetical protein